MRAKESQEKWAREGRIMNLSQVRKSVREDQSCDSLAEYFSSKVFLIQERHDRECVLFFALRDIAVNEELLWDYGMRRSAFQGEGWDLSWLDD
ncbi:hypothetical protein DPX16_23332 [Anabarilius grahami]|uniref:SET domain-containing protein n=1 Tax=Anabarilius grahami TaxID=495550 RepID=A0A3N0Z842_ANAGA|nr:hypothetical protein DPX16_23332 [Anabarilius grahami]